MMNQKGFTLIELMIVVAIIGILAAIAIPSYQDYTRRAAVSELINALAPVKTSLSEYYVVNSAWPANKTQGGLVDPVGKYITGTLTYTASTGATVSAQVSGTPATGNTVITVTGDGSNQAGVQWTCVGSPTKYAPSSCR